jgi:hypothetical protein
MTKHSSPRELTQASTSDSWLSQVEGFLGMLAEPSLCTPDFLSESSFASASFQDLLSPPGNCRRSFGLT